MKKDQKCTDCQSCPGDCGGCGQDKKIPEFFTNLSVAEKQIKDVMQQLESVSQEAESQGVPEEQIEQFLKMQRQTIVFNTVDGLMQFMDQVTEDHIRLFKKHWPPEMVELLLKILEDIKKSAEKIIKTLPTWIAILK